MYAPHASSDPNMDRSWSTKPRARVSPEQNVGWVSRSRVIDVTGFEYSTGSTSDATSSVYASGLNYCSNTVETNEPYVLEPVREKGVWYPDSGVTHHVCKGSADLNNEQQYSGMAPLLMGDGT